MERCPDQCIDIICLCFYRDGVEVRCSEYIQAFVSSRVESGASMEEVGAVEMNGC